MNNYFILDVARHSFQSSFIKKGTKPALSRHQAGTKSKKEKGRVEAELRPSQK